MTINSFKNIAFKALRISYGESQLFRLSFDSNVTRLTEYFITVNLCKQLHQWNVQNNYQFKIEAEKETFEFYNNCFECYRFELIDDFFPETIYAYSHENFLNNISDIRKGRIDIALSTEINNKRISETIIEVKSINPNTTKLKADYKRIQQYLKSSIPNFENSLKNGFIVFVKHINNVNKVQDNESLQKAKEVYLLGLKKELSTITYQNITFNIYTDYIENSPFESLILREDEDDFSEIAYRTFSAFSVIIEIKRHLK